MKSAVVELKLFLGREVGIAIFIALSTVDREVQGVICSHFHVSIEVEQIQTNCITRFQSICTMFFGGRFATICIGLHQVGEPLNGNVWRAEPPYYVFLQSCFDETMRSTIVLLFAFLALVAVYTTVAVSISISNISNICVKTIRMKYWFNP